MVIAEKLHPAPREFPVVNPNLEALLPYQGRDMEITYEGDLQLFRGPCTIGFENEEKSHPSWFTFTMPWLATEANNRWVLDRDTPVKRIATPETTIMRTEENGSATLELKGGVTYRFMPEEDRIVKPTARNTHI